jgi:hypothetical protein
MKPVAALAVGVLLLATVVSAQTGAAQPLTLAEYKTQLNTLQQRIRTASASEVGALLTSIPTSFNVQDGPSHYEVPLTLVRDRVQAAAKDARQWESAQKDSLAQLHALEVEADVPAASADYSAARVRLSAILSRREFGAVREPNWWDRTKARLYDLMQRALGALFLSAANWRGTRYVIYSIAGLILLLFGWWLWRMLAPTSADVPFELTAPAVSDKHWSSWLSESRAAAENGSWRDAVHLAYWAAISFLEAQGLWRPDRARTPREYLRLLPASAAVRVPLIELTRDFERAWYAQQPAGATEYQQALQHLDAIGCR